MRCRTILIFLLAASSSLPASADPPLHEDAAQALRRATDFFCGRAATEGGYLWRYRADLSEREGEGRASNRTVWVQPPGTPAVGMALLNAFEQTGDRHYFALARDAGKCLVRGQLRSGGWDYRIEFDPEVRRRYAYRVDPLPKSAAPRNMTTLDDNNTQSAIHLLIQLDQALEFKDKTIHEAARFALSSLLKAQYPNGGWPQRYDAFPDPEQFPAKKAAYPDAWSRQWPRAKYYHYYTLNDNTTRDLIDVLLAAGRIYREEKYRQAALRAGDFLLLAQLPEPQPAWAQQYDINMHPAWARRFEPPSVTGGESQGAIRTLMRLYRETGERKYLEPIPRAIAYLRRSQLADGRLARFYELKTNRPLYFTTRYELTYDDDDLPTHYGFKISHRLDRLESEYARLAKQPPPAQAPPTKSAKRRRAKASPAMISQVRSVIAALDKQGRWVEAGKLRHHGPDAPPTGIIDSRTFIRNVGILSAYLGTEP